MSVKNQTLAAYLNVFAPGLGCLYLQKWLYAIAYFVWVPLAILAAGFLIGLITDAVKVFSLPPIILNGAIILIAFFLRALILNDVFYTPYRLAIQINQEQSNTSEMVDGDQNPLLGAYLNLVLPGLGYLYLRKWSYLLCSILLVPVALIFRLIFLGIIGNLILELTKNYAIAIAVILILAFLNRALILWVLVFPSFRSAKKPAIPKDPV